MSSLQRRLDQEASTFPVQDDIWPGESGQGYVLRMCAQNGLGGVTRVKDMLGITRYQTLDASLSRSCPRSLFEDTSGGQLLASHSASHVSPRLFLLGAALGRGNTARVDRPCQAQQMLRNLRA